MSRLEKPAQPDHTIHELIVQRWSPRAFEPRSITEEQLLTVLEAGRWAASAMNEQPWRFVVALRDEEEDFARLLGVLAPGNQTWAKDAGALLLGVTSERNMQLDEPNPHSRYDLGQSVALLVLQAEALGLRVHQMGGFSAELAREHLHIPAGFDPTVALAIGYQAAPDTLPEGLHQREVAPRTRRPLSETIHRGTW